MVLQKRFASSGERSELCVRGKEKREERPRCVGAPRIWPRKGEETDKAFLVVGGGERERQVAKPERPERECDPRVGHTVAGAGKEVAGTTARTREDRREGGETEVVMVVKWPSTLVVKKEETAREQEGEQRRKRVRVVHVTQASNEACMRREGGEGRGEWKL